MKKLTNRDFWKWTKTGCYPLNDTRVKAMTPEEEEKWLATRPIQLKLTGKDAINLKSMLRDSLDVYFNDTENKSRRRILNKLKREDVK